MSAFDALQRTRLRLPIRFKLAMVSAALTFVILLLFALVTGVFTERRLQANFEDDLRATAADLTERLQGTEIGDEGLVETIRAAAAGGAAIRIVTTERVLTIPRGAPDLGEPVEGVRDAGDYRVVARPLLAAEAGPRNPFDPLEPPALRRAGFVQYAKPEASLNRTIARVRLFLALGVLGGTALAFLAGFLVARRAMRPIADLTRAAREVARTRDPAVVLPKPGVNDEVADLAHTLEDMLSELGAARAETEAALARQREFVADASHELRTPLTSILANLELLEAELAGEQGEIAGSALRSSRRMRRLVADLLLLARADAGRRAPGKPLDLAAVARDAVAEAAPLAEERQVSLDAPAPVPVHGVPDDLHRLALNLIENALIHTPAGTPVTVSARRNGGSGVLEVADRGPGVPPAMRARVFERVARGDGAATARGSGLGLAIVRAVADAHGGEVSLDEAPGGGARFQVRLPAAEEAGLLPATPPPRRAAPSAGA